MASLEWIQQQPSRKELRDFSFVWAFVCVLIAVVPLLKGEDFRLWPLYTACGFVLVGLTYPPLLTALYHVWSRFGKVLGVINSRIILTLLFFGIITPTACVMRVMGRDPLKRKLEKRLPSYWETRVTQPQSMRYQY